MIYILPLNMFRFIALIALQILVLNNVELDGTINPYVYPLFILLLPFSTPKWLLLILGFATGLVVDVFSNSIGMHASALTLLAFLRPVVIRVLTPRGGYEMLDSPSIKHLGFQWVFAYTSILILAHHFLYFAIEVASGAGLGYFILKFIITSVISLLIIFLLQFLFQSKRANAKF